MLKSTMSRMSFELWMARVDGALYDALGMDSADLPDQPYRDHYESGMTPEEAASAVAEELAGGDL